jgi:hypothetical protein
MSWEQYGEILLFNREQRAIDRNREPVECPNDGTPLQQAPNGKLHCPSDGWTWPDKRILGRL